MTFNINNSADLKLIAATLHDARFTADAINYDKAARILTLKCWVREPKQKRFNGSVMAQLAQDKIDSAGKTQRLSGFKAFFSFCARAFQALWRPGVTNDPRPWKACQLSFANVVDCKVNAKEKVRCYELATIRFSERDHKLDLVTHCAIEINLAVGELDGSLTETGETHDKWD